MKKKILLIFVLLFLFYNMTLYSKPINKDDYYNMNNESYYKLNFKNFSSKQINCFNTENINIIEIKTEKINNKSYNILIDNKININKQINEFILNKLKKEKNEELIIYYMNHYVNIKSIKVLSIKKDLLLIKNKYNLNFNIIDV